MQTVKGVQFLNIKALFTAAAASSVLRTVIVPLTSMYAYL